jgi:hypothetical protein
LGRLRRKDSAINKETIAANVNTALERGDVQAAADVLRSGYAVWLLADKTAGALTPRELERRLIAKNLPSEGAAEAQRIFSAIVNAQYSGMQLTKDAVLDWQRQLADLSRKLGRN